MTRNGNAETICNHSRYVTKEDVAVASLSKANSSGGSVRMVSKEATFNLKTEATSVGEKDGPSTK